MTDKKRTANQKRGPTTRERIRYIADLMAAGAYVTRDTARVLSREWDCSPKTVENLASQAANLLRMSLGNDEQLRSEVLGTLKRIEAIAFKRATETYPATLPDGTPHPRAGELRERYAYQWFNTAIQALDRLADITGIAAPKKVDVTTEHSLDEIATLAAAIKANTCGANSEKETSGRESSQAPSQTSELFAGWPKSSPKPDAAKN